MTLSHLKLYLKPEKGDESTIVIWRDRESLNAYRGGELIKEALAFEKKIGLEATTREGYPLIFPDMERSYPGKERR